MIASDLGLALLVLTVPLAVALDVLRIELLYAVALGIGTLGLFHSVANQSMLPTLVARSELVEANSKLAVGRSASQVAGPGVGGVLVQLITAPTALLVDAATFVVSAFAVWSIRSPEPDPKESSRGNSVIEDARQGLNLIVRNRVLAALGGVIGTMAVFNALYEAVWILYVSQRLDIDPLALGTMISIGSVGVVIGAFVASRVIRWVGIGRAVLVGSLIPALSDLVTPLAGGHVVVVLALLTSAMFLFGLGATLFDVANVSLRQAVTPIHLQGRMNAIMSLLEVGLVPIGALVGGVLGQWLGLRATLLIGAGGEVAAGAWLLRRPVWSLRDLPGQSDEES